MFKKILFALASASLFSSSLSANAAVFAENFSTTPVASGWKVFGEPSLFHWDSTNQNLKVTWDSSRPNSYFYRPLGTVLAKDDDFSLSFDVTLSDITIGVDTNKPYTFQIAIGFLNFGRATNSGFIRGSGFQAPNLVEFNYFPDSGFGTTVSTPVISTNNGYASGGFTVGLELTPTDLFHVEMHYFSSNQTLKTIMTKNGTSFGPVEDTVLGVSFSDFRVDTVGVASYSDAGQDPDFGGSILANGVVDNIVVTIPETPIGSLAGEFSSGARAVQFQSRTNWAYILERTMDFQTWTNVSPSISGSGTNLILQDTNGAPANAFYRVRATR